MSSTTATAPVVTATAPDTQVKYFRPPANLLKLPADSDIVLIQVYHTYIIIYETLLNDPSLCDASFQECLLFLEKANHESWLGKRPVDETDPNNLRVRMFKGVNGNLHYANIQLLWENLSPAAKLENKKATLSDVAVYFALLIYGFDDLIIDDLKERKRIAGTIIHIAWMNRMVCINKHTYIYNGHEIVVPSNTHQFVPYSQLGAIDQQYDWGRLNPIHEHFRASPKLYAKFLEIISSIPCLRPLSSTFVELEGKPFIYEDI